MTLLLNAGSGFDPDAPLPLGAPSRDSLYSDSRTIQGESYGDDPYSEPPNPVYQIGKSLSLNETVDWDEGGTHGPSSWLGFNTGVDTSAFKANSGGMTGEVVVPEDTQLILLTSDYGDVGLDDSSNRMAAAVKQQNDAWLPSDDQLAKLSIDPGFGLREVD